MPKKILVLIAAMLLVVVIVTAVTFHANPRQKEESSAEDSITDEMLVIPSEIPEKISVTPAAGFTETASPYYNKYYVKDDASVIITGEPLVIYGQSLDDYAAGVLRQYESTADDFQLLSEDTVTLTQVPCRIYEFRYAIVGEDVRQDMQCMTALLLKDDYAYLITCKSRKETFPAHRNAFHQMIDSIEIASDSPFYQNPGSAIEPDTQTTPATTSAE